MIHFEQVRFVLKEEQVLNTDHLKADLEQKDLPENHSKSHQFQLGEAVGSVLESDSVSIMLYNPEIPVGGRLKHFLPKWKLVTQDKWVLSITQHGYKLEKQKFKGVKETKISAKNSSNQLKTSEQVSPAGSFQDGHIINSNQSCKERRLWYFNRPKRCLFSHSNTSEASPLSEVQFSGPGLSVQSTLLWCDISPKSFYKSSSSNSCVFETTANKTCHISRRLDCSQSDVSGANCGSNISSNHINRARIHGQSVKIQSCSKSMSRIHRVCSPSRQGFSISHTKQGYGYQTNNSEVTNTEQYGSGLFTSVGFDCIMYTTGFKSTTFHETKSNACSQALESFSRQFRQTDSVISQCVMSHELVVIRSQHFSRQILNPYKHTGHNCNRCFKEGIGRTFQRSD
ncbi:hypothetical protein DPMN_013530 [Dreissena polymorpha]|uniref:Uncharacterized protein n=1 Tax=Dreissena polymorpha TaxID=45954 RepID=A0A9D4N959_DREPO|nr:hypothetical protein DPMN_013530 [Dreissena polymorpha]